MTQSPKKLGSNYIEPRSQRGAGDLKDDHGGLGSSLLSSESCARAGAGDSDDTSSCLQIVVEKQRQRVPAASSPCPAPPAPQTPRPPRTDQPLLLVLPYTDDYNMWSQNNPTTQPEQPPPPAIIKQKSKLPQTSLWHKLKDVATDTSVDNECGGVEVYWLERAAGGALTARGGWGERDAASARAAAAAGRVAARALAEVLGAGRALAWAPMSLAVATLRCGLGVLRDSALGTLGAFADFVFKPALALLYNGLVQPVCVTLRATAVAAEEVAAPTARALCAAVTPLAHVLAACRLVHVHVERPCTCRPHTDTRSV